MGVAERDVYIGFVAIADDDKRFVVLNVSGEFYHYLLINSKMTNYQLRNTRIGNLQMPLAHLGREAYLKWDSFLSCEKVHEGRVRDLHLRISAGEVKKLGVMSKSDFENARALIFNHGVYSKIELEAFGMFDEDFE